MAQRQFWDEMENKYRELRETFTMDLDEESGEFDEQCQKIFSDSPSIEKEFHYFRGLVGAAELAGIDTSPNWRIYDYKKFIDRVEYSLAAKYAKETMNKGFGLRRLQKVRRHELYNV